MTTASSLMRAALRLLRSVVLLVVVLLAAAAALLAFPQPLFPHGLSQGRLELRSDRLFSEEAGRRILIEVEARITRSPLDRQDVTHRIFVVNEGWRQRLTFLWNYGAGGVNWYPLTRNVFVRPSDIEADRVISSLGLPVPPPRTLTYFAAHEIGHSLTAMHIGALAYHTQLPVWIREGLADYIGQGSATDPQAMLRSPDYGEPPVIPGARNPYAPYHVLVALLLQREGWTLDRLLASRMTQQEAVRMLQVQLLP